MMNIEKMKTLLDIIKSWNNYSIFATTAFYLHFLIVSVLTLMCLQFGEL